MSPHSSFYGLKMQPLKSNWAAVSKLFSGWRENQDAGASLSWGENGNNIY
jgi:hypothetical protein